MSDSHVIVKTHFSNASFHDYTEYNYFHLTLRPIIRLIITPKLFKVNFWKKSGVVNVTKPFLIFTLVS